MEASPQPRRTDWVGIGLIYLIAMLGMAAAIHACRFGVGVTPDSAVYLSAAHRFAVGEGLSKVNTGVPLPLTWFPPLYPLVLGLAEKLGWNARSAAGALNVVCWGGVIVLAGLIARRGCGGSRVAGVLGAMAGLCVPAMLWVSAHALAEPLFLVLTLGTLCCLITFGNLGGGKALLGAGVLAGLAILTRFAGLSLVPAGMVVIGLLSTVKVWRRLGQAAVYAGLAVAPIALWNVFRAVQGIAKSPRLLAWHPITTARVQEGLMTLARFVVPVQISGAVAGGAVFALGAAVGLGTLMIYRRRKADGAAWCGVCASLVFVVTYVAFLVVSICIADEGTPLDGRILSPVVVPLWVAMVTMVWALASGREWVKATAAVLMGAALGGQAVTARPHLFDQSLDGVFTKADAEESLLLEAVRDIPPGSVVFSNQPSAVYLFTHCPNDSLPEVDDPNAAEPEADEAQMDVLENALDHGGGPVYVIYWLDERVEFGEPVMSEKQLVEHAKVEERRVFADGIILRLSAKEQ